MGDFLKFVTCVSNPGIFSSSRIRGMRNTSYVSTDGWNHLDFAEFSFTNIPASAWPGYDMPTVGMVCSELTAD